MTRTVAALDFVDDHLLGLVVAAVAVGFLFPSLDALTTLTLPLLAVMVGSVSLTLSPAAFRSVDRRALGVVLLAQTAMAPLAYGIATALGLAPAQVLGFVVLGAVTPELVTPTMTARAGGDTALATTVLVVVGVGSVVLVPGFVGALAADAPVRATRIVENLLLAVVLPMGVAVALRARFPERVGGYDDRYPAISALAVVLVIGIVAAANAEVVRANLALVPPVAAGAVALNAGGYGLGRLASAPFDRPTRIAGTLSVGMRDFAVAAALVVAAGFPPAAALPAVVFGVVEMATSAALSGRWKRAAGSS